MSNPANLPALSTFANLRGIPAIAAPQYPLIYVAAGSSTYQWNAADTTADNNWTVINPTGNASTGRWNRINPVPESLNIDPVANLKDWMDIYYGAGNWTYRTAAHTGSDAGVAATAALQWIRTTFGRGTLKIPSTGGIFLFKTSPNTDLLSGNFIVGDGSQATIVCADFNSGVLFQFDAAGGNSGGGMRGLAIYLEQDYPSSTTTAIAVNGTSSFQMDQTLWEDIYISAFGSSFWFNGINFDGTARASPQGIRVGSMNDIVIFRCSGAGAQFLNCVQFTVTNLGVYVGSGTGSNLYIGGGGSSSTNTIEFYMFGCNVNGQLNLTNCSLISWNSGLAATLNGDTTCQFYIIDGFFLTVPGSNPLNTTAGTFRYAPLLG